MRKRGSRVRRSNPHQNGRKGNYFEISGEKFIPKCLLPSERTAFYMQSAPEVVIIVDGYSTGQYFAPRLRRLGYRIVHISSSTTMSHHVATYLQDIQESYGTLYEAWLEYSGDLPGLIDALHRWEPVTVIAGAESGVELADLLAETLGLPGNSTRMSPARRNKARMQDALRGAGVPTMRYFEGDDLEDLLDTARSWNRWPVVIKPVKSAGTEGVRFCRDEDELVQAFKELTARPDIFGNINTTVLLEECLDGTEYVVNTVSCGGKHYLCDFWEYKKIRIPGAAPLYDYVRLLPYPEPKSPLHPLVEYTKRALDALEISHGPAHSEVMMTPEGPRLIETGARVMGASISPDLLDECIGQNQVDWTIQAHLEPERFCREAPLPYRIRNHLLLKILISNRAGKVRDVPLLDILVQLQSAYSGDLVHLIESSHLEKTVDFLTVPGTICLKHQNEKVVMADYQTLADMELMAAEQLFELDRDSSLQQEIDGWFTRLPDELWLKEEKEGAADAGVITRCLNLKPGEEILDIPCGDGRVGIHLARNGMHLVGIDINPRFIALARRRFKAEDLPGEFLLFDMRNLPFESRFDAVVNWFNSFGYFGPDTDQLVMERLVAALKPGGRILIEAPSVRNVMQNLRKKEYEGDTLRMHWNDEEKRVELTVPVKKEDGSDGHVQIRDYMYSLADYQDMMQGCGLHNIAVYDEEGMPFSDTSQRMVIVGYKPE